MEDEEVEFSQFFAEEYLKTNDDILIYLDEAYKIGDKEFFKTAVNDCIRAVGIEKFIEIILPVIRP